MESKRPSLEAFAAKFDGEDPIIADGQLESNVSSLNRSL